jgi:crotonobetainyl-CoA:carnitine CoA-transferase CaiB-like acyl-CoA transferase
MNYLSGLDVCFAPVNTLPEALDDPNLRARAMLLTDEAGRRHIAPAIHFRDEPAQPTLREPLLGEHTAEILARIEPDQPVPRAAGR